MCAWLKPLRKDPMCAFLIRCVLKISNLKKQTRKTRIGKLETAFRLELLSPSTGTARRMPERPAQFTKRRMRTFITSPKARNTKAVDDPP